ncbi:UNVERIFIED_CONTAM: hypothetical protein Slati_2960300 [Sesamum latifolium]|uniref:Uncharacterized protein n=1 Tax=Sesamum latifolium TaxID=2727402 RepID=A0AAW2VEM7_9LAMI
MRQRWWLELTKDCDLTINDHPRKANRVADALIRKASWTLAIMLAREIEPLELEVLESTEVILATLTTRTPIHERIKTPHDSDAELGIIKDKVKWGLALEFQVRDDGTLCLKGRLCVPNCRDLRRDILMEAHNSKRTSITKRSH